MLVQTRTPTEDRSKDYPKSMGIVKGPRKSPAIAGHIGEGSASDGIGFMLFLRVVRDL